MGITFYKKSDNVKLLLDELHEKKGVALEAVGMAAETYAKLNLENNPRRIDTGNLRNSISHAPDGDDTMCIGTDVEYAVYVELGTSRMKPSNYLKRSVMEHIDEYKNVIVEHMKD